MKNDIKIVIIHNLILFFRSETPISAMGEDSNHSVMSDSQDASEFTNKITNPSSSGPSAGPKEIPKE